MILLYEDYSILQYRRNKTTVYYSKEGTRLQYATVQKEQDISMLQYRRNKTTVCYSIEGTRLQDATV